MYILYDKYRYNVAALRCSLPTTSKRVSLSRQQQLIMQNKDLLLEPR